METAAAVNPTAADLAEPPDPAMAAHLTPAARRGHREIAHPDRKLRSEWIFPRPMDRSIRDDREVQALRTQTLDQSQGRVLELDVGTDLNLTPYATDVKHIAAGEPSSAMTALAKERMAAIPTPA